jgi:hypothetical protein
MHDTTDVARQIEILLTGLAQRAESAGLEDLARRLADASREAGEQARKRAPKT